MSRGFLVSDLLVSVSELLAELERTVKLQKRSLRF
jgi:hypothetical protein